MNRDFPWVRVHGFEGRRELVTRKFLPTGVSSSVRCFRVVRSSQVGLFNSVFFGTSRNIDFCPFTVPSNRGSFCTEYTFPKFLFYTFPTTRWECLLFLEGEEGAFEFPVRSVVTSPQAVRGFNSPPLYPRRGGSQYGTSQNDRHLRTKSGDHDHRRPRRLSLNRSARTTWRGKRRRGRSQYTEYRGTSHLR